MINHKLEKKNYIYKKKEKTKVHPVIQKDPEIQKKYIYIYIPYFAFLKNLSIQSFNRDDVAA